MLLCNVVSHLVMPRMQLLQFEGQKLLKLHMDDKPWNRQITYAVTYLMWKWCQRRTFEIHEAFRIWRVSRKWMKPSFLFKAGLGRREWQVAADGSAPCIHVSQFHISQREHALLHNGTVLMVAHSECKISSKQRRKRIVSYKPPEMPLPVIQ